MAQRDPNELNGQTKYRLRFPGGHIESFDLAALGDLAEVKLPGAEIVSVTFGVASVKRAQETPVGMRHLSENDLIANGLTVENGVVIDADEISTETVGGKVDPPIKAKAPR